MNVYIYVESVVQWYAEYWGADTDMWRATCLQYAFHQWIYFAESDLLAVHYLSYIYTLIIYTGKLMDSYIRRLFGGRVNCQVVCV